MREEISYSVLSVSNVTTHENDSMLYCRMESDVEDLTADGALLLDMLSSSDESEDDSNELEDRYHAMEQQSPESPAAPDVSYLSFVDLEHSAHVVSQLGSPESPTPVLADERPWHGYTIYGDNIDKNIHPRHQTVSMKTQSLHMFQSFVNYDRVNLAGISDESPMPIRINPDLLMPSASDMQSITSRFVIMISR